MSEIRSNSNLETEDLNILSADNPLTNPKDDKLGYASFAENLAKSICKMSPSDGLVMAVYAPWGSGKSTLLNFIVHYLEQKPEEEQPIIVPFNPWWFSGQEDLTKSFFDQLLGVLYDKWQSLDANAKELLTSLAERVAPIPGLLTKGFAATVNTIIQPKDIHKLKKEVEELLRKENKKILIVIDDIDRLTAEEIRQLFRVIKAVANFPNVIYLLLFDKEVVVKALEDIQKIDGEAYLEKIVQVPFELPLPDKFSLRKIFEVDIEKIFADTPEELFQEDHWRDVYLQGIEHFITTPRSIRRLINTLMVTYPAVKGEVNFVDFIAIETIRVFCPLIYNIVRHNSELFSGYMLYETASSYMSEEERKIFHDSWISQINKKDKKAVKNIMRLIFPGIRTPIEHPGVIIMSQELAKDNNQLRISVGEIFPRYFHLSIPEGDISNSEMKAILTLASDSQAFAEKLLEFSNQIRPDGTSRVKLFLNRLRDLDEKDIPLNCVPSILEALFKVGDNLLRLEDQINSSFAMGNEYEIEFLIHQLLERIEKEKRGIILQESMQKGQAIFTIVWQVISLGEQHSKYEATRSKPEEERLVNSQQLEELEQVALDKIKKAAYQDKIQFNFLKVPKLRSVLAFWRDLCGVEEIKQWVQKVIEKDKDLVEVIENNFVQNTKLYRLYPQWLSYYLEASEIINRVRSLAEDTGLAENQKLALQQYIKEYEMIERGESLSQPFP
ncbi:AAA family ATPase [Anabaena cylindrica FACHB-243]|nr:AAA family ATPase [Anabaena cylindrica FACHB-243]MBY5283859.1 AAA family ATPase [Anabaena sp. CCAP 1446/1C]MBY5311633.1 AAA family ATPase [Anabaena sp. CCAP 1446/1C]